MTESTQPADLSKSAPAVDMSRTFSARVMALPLPEPKWTEVVVWDYYVGERNSYQDAYSDEQMRNHAAAIAAEADALAEAARGLRVALCVLAAYPLTERVEATPSARLFGADDWWLHSRDVLQARAALAAFDKAAGGAAPQPPVAWVGPTGQLMPHEIFVAWREQYPDQGHEHFRPLVYGDAA